MKYETEKFRRFFPLIRDYLDTVVPELVKQYDTYVRRLGARCIYARATLKIIFIEAKRRDRDGFEHALRARGY
jgi:hypothetical protein